MVDRGGDDPRADLYRELLEHEARLERLIEQLLHDDAPPEPAASTARQVPAATSDAQIPLTKREAQVLQLLVTGRTNRQIGAVLHLRAGSVRNRLTQIYRKLGVTTRTQAAIRAIELGLVKADPSTR